MIFYPMVRNSFWQHTSFAMNTNLKAIGYESLYDYFIGLWYWGNQQ